MFTAARDLGSPYDIDDLSFLTDVTRHEHHAAIVEALWSGLGRAARADARISIANGAFSSSPLRARTARPSKTPSTMLSRRATTRHRRSSTPTRRHGR